MEEYSKANHDYTASEGSINRAVAGRLHSELKAGLHRHVSLSYGLQFQSKVALLAVQHQHKTTITDFQNISKQQLYKKVLSFLKVAVQDNVMLDTFIKSFKILDEEMNFEIKKSTHSIPSQSSQLSLGSDSDQGSQRNVKEVLVERINLADSALEVQNSALKKGRTSMMCKSNRISIAEAINITQLQRSAKMEAIQSAESLQSKKSSPIDFKSKRRLSSQHSDQLSDTGSITDAKGGKKAEHKKISIMMLEDLSMSNSLFSQEEIHISLSQIKLPKLALNQVMLQVFFDPPTPYLVNLTLCLLCKCLARGHIVLSLDSVGWLLGVSTIVAYKLYYDQPIQGLMEWFCEGMNMDSGELVKLERWFLGCLNYEAAVSSQQYHNMLMKLMMQQ